MDVTEPIDLAPRTVGVPDRPPRRRWPWVVVVVGVIAALGFVLSRAVTDASLFFYNVDEAVAKRSETGVERRFRLQGSVVGDTTRRTAEGVTFDVKYNGVVVTVHHVGDPPDLFKDGIPVVLEGHWEGTAPGAAFASDRMLIKHDATYDAKNPDRVREAGEGGSAPVPAPAGAP